MNNNNHARGSLEEPKCNLKQIQNRRQSEPPPRPPRKIIQNHVQVPGASPTPPPCYEEEEERCNNEPLLPQNGPSHPYKDISLPKRVNYAEIRKYAKRGPQIFTAIAVSTGCISYGICMAYTSSAIPSILGQNSTLNINNDESSWMSSLFALGCLLGSIISIFLMDAIGRKAALLAFSVMSLFIGWTLLMAASQAWQLYVGRFLLGLGAGLEITICPVYIYETTRPDMRDICGSFPQVMTSIGILVCYSMGQSLAWNWLSLASMGFLVPFTIGLYYVPESPPWLVYNEEEDLAFRSMALIRGEEYDASQEIARVKELLSLHDNQVSALYWLDHEQESSIEYEREQPILQSLFVVIVLMLLLQGSGQGAIIFYTAQIFQDVNSSLDPNYCALVLGLTHFLSSLVTLILKNVTGRRILLLISQAGMAATMFCLGFYFQMDDFSLSLIPIPILIMYTISYNLGLGSLTWAVATEVLPPKSRQWTYAAANFVSNTSLFIVTKTFHDTQDLFGMSAPFFCFGAVSFLGFVFIFVFLPENPSSNNQVTSAGVIELESLLGKMGCPLLAGLVKPKPYESCDNSEINR